MEFKVCMNNIDFISFFIFMVVNSDLTINIIIETSNYLLGSPVFIILENHIFFSK